MTDDDRLIDPRPARGLAESPGPDVDTRAGEQKIRDVIAAAEEVPPPPEPGSPEAIAGPCPVQPLGARDGIYHYLTPRGEYRALSFKDHRKQGIISLFDGATGWLWDRFPRYSNAKDGEEPKVIGWHEEAASTWLMRRGSEVGFFNAERDIRGVGTWRIDPASDSAAVGQLILHCGNAIRIGNDRGKQAWQKPGRELDGVIYPAAEPMPRPSDTPAPPSLARELIDHISTWAWIRADLAPWLALGWIGVAMIVGAVEWTPHILVTGDRGSGKTEFMALIKSLLGRALLSFSDPTEAALRQSLRHGAHPVAVDEIENSKNNARVTAVMELTLLASDIDQAPKGRGTLGGVAQRYPIRAAFLLSAILHPPMSSAAASRIEVLELGRPTPDAAVAGSLSAKARYFASKAPDLRARMVDGFERFLGNLAVVQLLLVEVGYSSRQADQYGTLLAAAFTLLRDELMTKAMAVGLVNLLPKPIAPGESDDSADHSLALNHLLSTQVDRHWSEGAMAGREPMTIGELLRSAPGSTSAHKTLRRHGIAIVDLDGIPHFAVANQHRGLEEIFAGTRWAEGVWVQPLRRLPNAVTRDAKVRFAGVLSRATWLPLDLLPEDGEEPS